MAKDKEVLEIAAIQAVDGKVYVFTVSAHSSEIRPFYILDIRSHHNFDSLEFRVDPQSMQKLTAWFATAVVCVSQSMGVKRTKIQDEGDFLVFAIGAHTSGLPGCQLDIRIQGEPTLGISFWVNLYGLQQLTASFAKAALGAKKYEGSFPPHGTSDAAA